MVAIKDADEYIIKFLYKKQVKIDITLLFFLAVTTVISFITKCSIYLSGLLSLATVTMLAWSIREFTAKEEINRHNHIKARYIYIISIILYIFMPSSTYFLVSICIIPLSILFISLVETYSGHDALHWPYLYHLIYGSVILLCASIAKSFIPLDVFFVTDNFLIFYKPVAFTVVVDHIACELVDLRTIFKAKMFRDEIVACYDKLTETHNRYGLMEFCDLEKSTAVAMIDLDHFKMVNDTYNHNIGDYILKEFARRLSIYEDDNNFICRWGGEEFIIIAKSRGDLIDICSRLLISMRNNPIAFTFDDKNILYTQTFSCGIADIVPGKAIDEMVKLADIQAYKAKNNGRNHVYYNDEEVI